MLSVKGIKIMKKVVMLCLLAASMSTALAQTALKINGQTISAAEQKELMELLAKEKGIKGQEAQLTMARQILSEEKIIGQAAWRQKLERDPLVKRKIAESKSRIYREALVNSYLSKHPVTDQELSAAYEALKRQHDPNEVQIRYILVDSEKEAKDLLYLIEIGEKMDKLAKEKSLDKASAADGGLLPFTAVSKFNIPGFANAVKGLKKGQLYKQPIKSQHGYQIFRLEDSRVVPMPPLEQIKTQVQATAVQQKSTAYLNSLFRGAKIEQASSEKRKAKTVLPARK